MVENISITNLDLSHNKIADRGVRALAKLLDNRSVIAILNLEDNQIHSEGGRALARAIRGNFSLISLNVRLNRLGDDGGRTICDVLRANQVMERLSIGCNQLGAMVRPLGLGCSSRMGFLLCACNLIWCCRLALQTRKGPLETHITVDASEMRHVSDISAPCSLQTVQSISALLRLNHRVKELDLSGNSFDEQGGRLIREALDENTWVMPP